METLGLNFSKPQTPPELVSELLSKSSPSFTFYRHPGTSMLYLIYHSPDDATVQQRMKHTIAIPGLLVHAEDAGIRVDRKIEIHDPDDLVFEEAKDERVGRFRSMYRRDEFNGTELTYEGMERDKAFLDAL
jgi:twinfilin-like protein